MKRREILLKLFEITEYGDGSLEFLKLFRSIEPEKFALIYFDTQTLLGSFEQCIYTIQFLYELDLIPVVLIHESVIEYINLFNKNKLQRIKIQNKFSYINHFDRNLIHSKIKKRKIPVLLFKENEKIPTSLIIQLLQILKSNKFVYVQETGGFYSNSEKNIISIINIKDQSSLPITTSQLKLLKTFQEIYKIIDYKPFSISYTSPNLALKELFTIKGSGTLIKKRNQILQQNILEEKEKLILTKIIEKSFKRKLKKDFFQKKIDLILIDEHHMGCAVLIKTEFGFFLSKFAVDKISQGSGLGGDIWDEIEKLQSPLFWRAKNSNPINKWYQKKCSGFQKSDSWNYYWIRVEDKNLQSILKLLKNLPEDFL